MAVPLAALVLIGVALVAAACALAAFVWAVRSGQFSLKQLNEGAYAVFDEEDVPGEMHDRVFGNPDD